LISIAGTGGYGNVWKANYNLEIVAVKRLSTTDPEPIMMFAREMCMMCKLEHKNIVKYIGSSMKPPFMFLVMEFVPQNLHDIIKTSKPIEKQIFNKFIQGIVEGMIYLHNLKIIHRDLKPGNILVTETNDTKIADFGISKISDGTATMTRIGTPTYMAPEILLALKYGENVDIYSFGMILWQLFTRQKPLSSLGANGENLEPIQFAIKIAYEKIRPEIPTECPLNIKNLITKCWDHCPSVRPSFVEIRQMLLEGLLE